MVTDNRGDVYAASNATLRDLAMTVRRQPSWEAAIISTSAPRPS